jgi:hypothetical protein
VDETNPADAASIRDPARYRFGHLTDSQADTRDRELPAKLNLKVALDGAAAANLLKFGAKFQQRRRTADTERRSYDPGAVSRTMTGLVGTASVRAGTMGYEFGPVPDTTAVAALLTAASAAFRYNPLPR